MYLEEGGSLFPFESNDVAGSGFWDYVSYHRSSLYRGPFPTEKPGRTGDGTGTGFISCNHAPNGARGGRGRTGTTRTRKTGASRNGEGFKVRLDATVMGMF